MVTDKIENMLFYRPMTPTLGAGIAAVKAIEKLEPGKYRFDGGYFDAQRGGTEPMNEGIFEAYRRYIDVQILVKGCEGVAWTGVGNLKTVAPYDREKDAERLSGDTKNHVRVDQGMFYIASPHDGHKPVSYTDKPHSFIKIIIEMPVSERVQAYFSG